MNQTSRRLRAQKPGERTRTEHPAGPAPEAARAAAPEVGPLSRLFGHARPIIGMVHLGPLPGSPAWGGKLDVVLARAVADADALVKGGARGVLVENFGDAPFFPGPVEPETVAAMTRVVGEIRRFVSVPVGVNVLRNDAHAALAIAAATGAAFIRVNVHLGVMATDQGMLAGRAHETLRLRKTLGLETWIFADLFVKHATPLYERTVDEMAAELITRGGADGLIVTGRSTGAAPRAELLRHVRAAVPGVPVLIGSGLSRDNVLVLLPESDGAIVGTYFKRGGVVREPVDPDRVRGLVALASGVHGHS